MQDGAEDDFSEHHVNHQRSLIDNRQPTTISEPTQEPSLSGHSHSALENLDQQQNGTFPHPSKRRKLTDPEIAKGQRPISPPWKKVAADGPSTFLEGGVRKSARTNYVPVDLHAQSDKRKTRGAIQHGKEPVIKSKYGGASVTILDSPTPTPGPNSSGLNGHRHTGSAGKSSLHNPSKSPAKFKSGHLEDTKPSFDVSNPPKRSHKKKVPPAHAQTIPALGSHQPRKVGRPRRSSVTATRSPPLPPINGWHSHHAEQKVKEMENAVSPDSAGKRHQRLNLRFNLPTTGIYHPENIVRRNEVLEGDRRAPRFLSFQDWLDKEGRLGLEGETDPLTTDDDAKREAQLRHRISEAANPGGVLSKDACSYWQPERSEEPPRLYTHQDRLLAHLKNFHMLLGKEKNKAPQGCQRMCTASRSIRQG